MDKTQILFGVLGALQILVQMRLHDLIEGVGGPRLTGVTRHRTCHSLAAKVTSTPPVG